ncbi:MAG: hypothetical protein K1060chlam5_01208 [Candidatus Anoxychlamydiales bacterium]|nr:hypothetical protein [Candidatus Anoxychlamydiales bacterium]
MLQKDGLIGLMKIEEVRSELIELEGLFGKISKIENKTQINNYVYKILVLVNKIALIFF